MRYFSLQQSVEAGPLTVQLLLGGKRGAVSL